MEKMTLLEYKYSNLDKYETPDNYQFGRDIAKIAIAYFPILLSITYNSYLLVQPMSQTIT